LRGTINSPEKKPYRKNRIVSTVNEVEFVIKNKEREIPNAPIGITPFSIYLLLTNPTESEPTTIPTPDIESSPCAITVLFTPTLSLRYSPKIATIS